MNHLRWSVEVLVVLISVCLSSHAYSVIFQFRVLVILALGASCGYKTTWSLVIHALRTERCKQVNMTPNLETDCK